MEADAPSDAEFVQDGVRATLAHLQLHEHVGHKVVLTRTYDLPPELIDPAAPTDEQLMDGEAPSFLVANSGDGRAK